MTESTAGAALAGDLAPMKGHGSFTTTGGTIDPTTGDIIFMGDTSGEATRPGRVTGTATELLFAPYNVAFTVEVTFVAADGDEVFAVFVGAFYDAASDSTGAFSSSPSADDHRIKSSSPGIRSRPGPTAGASLPWAGSPPAWEQRH